LGLCSDATLDANLVSLRRNILANYVGAGWSALMLVVFVPLYIRWLGIEAYGLIGVFALLQGCLSLLDLGLAPALSREFAQAPDSDNRMRWHDLLRSAEMTVTGMAVVVWLGFLACANWLAAHWLKRQGLDLAETTYAFMLMGGVVGARIIENVYRSVLVGRQRQVTLNLVAAVVATLRGAGAALVVCAISPTVTAYFLWQLAVSLLSLGLFSFGVRSVLPRATRTPRFSLPALRSIARFASGAMGIAVLSVLLTHLDKIFLSRLLSLEAFGMYSFAVVVAQTPLGLVGPIVQASFPRFAQLDAQQRNAELVALYHASAQLVTALLGAATIVLVVFGETLLYLWTHDAALAARTYPVVATLAVGSFLNGLMTVPYYLQMASGWTALSLRANLISLLMVLPALYLIVPVYGAIGAATVWLTLNACYVIFVVPIMHRRLLPRQLAAWYLGDVLAPLLPALASALALQALAHPPSSEIHAWIGLAFSSAIVLAVSVSCARSTRNALLDTIARYAKVHRP
jgi:O-antigen/teichoic acid export membrane protein